MFGWPQAAGLVAKAGTFHDDPASRNAAITYPGNMTGSWASPSFNIFSA